MAAIVPTSSELPPRARRILEHSLERVGQHGTTSACAENTCGHISDQHLSRNYLRVRGEYPACWYAYTFFRELPPRARRILHRMTLGKTHQGTTSACAENTRRCLLAANNHRNYLRVRGEYTAVVPTRCPTMELPPRARRILAEAVSVVAPLGTTSACAENTANPRDTSGAA